MNLNKRLIKYLIYLPQLNHFTFYFPGGPDDCTFENGSCGWTNIGGDIFDWTLLMGKTPSRETGPATDHTTLRFGEFYATCGLRTVSTKCLLMFLRCPNQPGKEI